VLFINSRNGKKSRDSASRGGAKSSAVQACGKVRFSVGAAIGDHAPVQRFDPLAGSALAKTGNEGMQQAGTAREKQSTGKGKGHALMFQVIFTDGLRMVDKQARKHGQTPF
jgi:hypothetical protein